MKINRLQIFIFTLFIFSSCTRVPSQKLRQWQDSSWANYENDTITLYLHNPLRCPLRFSISSTDSTRAFSQKLKPYSMITLGYTSDSLIKIPATKADLQSLKVFQGFGDPNEEINYNKMTLPFSPGKSYEVIQAYNGAFSHTGNYARYAIDFGLKHGDTVCAASGGYVVGIIKDYKDGGADEKWRDYANYITIYHPAYKLFTQYAHLKQNGVLVEIGDYIETGQPIGLAGRTGWTSIQHLHFNVLKAIDSTEWLESVPVDYYEGYDGKNLKPGDVVNKPGL